MRKIIASLDVGSNFIKLVVGESLKGKINILGVSCVPSAGVKNGFIVEPNVFLPKLEEAFFKCEDVIGLKIKKVIVTVPSFQAEFLLMEGVTRITNDEHLIKNSDILKAMDSSLEGNISKEREIISMKPTAFVIDDERTVKNPIGQEGLKLLVKALVTTVPKNNVERIMKCLAQLGVEVVDFSLNSIGDYYEFQTPKMKEEVGCIIHIGYQVTNVSIFNKGVLTNTEDLTIGTSNIEHDLSYIFHVTNKDAKLIKDELASAHKSGMSANVKKEFTTKEGETVSISEYEATEVASSRIEEILKLAKKEINLLTKKEIHYIIVTGGVSEMTNFNILVEEIFGHNAKVGATNELGARSNIYSSAVGLLKYYDEKTKMWNQDFSIFNEEETEELSNVNKKVNFGENSILGKLFGYFFDN